MRERDEGRKGREGERRREKVKTQIEREDKREEIYRKREKR